MQVAMRAECIGSFLNDSGIWMPHVWDKPNYNFDSFGKVSWVLMHAIGSVKVLSSMHIQQV